MERSDKYKIAVCNKTGMMAIYNPSKKIFISPMADGPIKFSSSIDGNMNVINVTKYGRDFSVLDVPYSFKLLMQELNAMNMQMRLITDDNIEQIEAMTFSNNIQLLGVRGKFDYKTKIDKVLKGEEDDKLYNISEDYSDGPKTPDYPPESPLYAASSDGPKTPDYPPDSPPDSPLYAASSDGPKTPDYPPDSPPDSPLYAASSDGPKTPDYPLDSPPYAPGSLDYPPDSPPDSPPYAPGSLDYPPESYGGNSKNNHINGIVYYRGYKGRDKNGLLQKWKVIKGGNKFCTIQKIKEPGSLFNPMNDLQIVRPEEIYTDSDIIGKPQVFQKPPNTEQNPGNNINFAPIIKINTKDIEDDVPVSSAVIEEMNETSQYEPDTVNDFTIKPKETKLSEDDNKNSKPIDFSNFIIKKV